MQFFVSALTSTNWQLKRGKDLIFLDDISSEAVKWNSMRFVGQREREGGQFIDVEPLRNVSFWFRYGSIFN